MPTVPTTIAFPQPLEAVRRDKQGWWLAIDSREVRVRNVEKPFWVPEGYTKGDLLTFYRNIAPWILPYLEGRALTLKRMPDGADGEFFYAKQVPAHAPEWVVTAPVRSKDTGKTVDYVLADSAATLLWLANLGCIELHPWHSRVDAIGLPDYAFFDLDPFDVGFDVVAEVALLVRTVLDRLGLRGYPRTSGATGMQVYVPIDRVHDASQVREWVGRVCRLIHRADPERTTMEWAIANRGSKVFLDHGMNTEGKNIAATYCLRPERGAPAATPVTWDEVEAGSLSPTDFTIATIFDRLDRVGDLFEPVLQGGQDLTAAMAALGMAAEEPRGAGHVVDSPPAARRKAAPARVELPAAPPEERLARYGSMRDFTKTAEPAPPLAAASARAADGGGPRFVVQHHLATRLHHDVRFEHHGTLPSWAVPKGLPDVPGVRHMAVQTEDHPLEYLEFSGEIPAGEYGGGPVRIWDTGTYEALEWTDDKVTVRLHGDRHAGEYHLFRIDRDDPKQWMVVRADEPRPEELPPPLPRLAPMLASSAEQPFDDPAWLFEVKWDGVRVLASVVRPGRGDPPTTTLTSRLGNDVSEAYPELAPLWERVLARSAVLDGEIVTFDGQGRPSFQLLQQRMHVREPRQLERLRQRHPVVYMVFDVLAIDGEPLLDVPLVERLARLEELVVPAPWLQRSVAVPGDGRALFAAAEERGLEGIVAKRATSVYRPGKRSTDWRKIKVRRRVEAVIGGWLPGEGARSGWLGSLLVGLYDGGELRYVGRVGTGFDDAELARLGARLEALRRDQPPFSDPPRERSARWVEPELVCCVEYVEATAGGRLRAPSYKGLLQVDPRTATLDLLELPAAAGSPTA